MPSCCARLWSTRSTPTPTRCNGSPPGTGGTTSTAVSTRRRRRPTSPPAAVLGPRLSHRRWCWSARPFRECRPRLSAATAYVANTVTVWVSSRSSTSAWLRQRDDRGDAQRQKRRQSPRPRHRRRERLVRRPPLRQWPAREGSWGCLLYTSDAADDLLCV